MRVVNAACPFAQCFVYGIFKRLSAARYSVDFRAEQFHAVNVERLTLCILLAHEDFAFHAHESGRRSSGNAVLTCARFGNDACFAHAFGEQYLSQNIVQFM